MKTLAKDWNYHKIDKKFRTIRNLLNSTLQKHKLSSMFNKLDQKITELMKHAEKKCANVASHHLDHWSPKLIASLRNTRHWRTELTKAAKLPYKVGFVQAIETFRYVESKLWEAEEEYNKFSKQARKIRWDFLEDQSKNTGKRKGH